MWTFCRIHINTAAWRTTFILKWKFGGKNDFPGSFDFVGLMTCVRFCSAFHFKFIDELAQISILAWVVTLCLNGYMEYQLYNWSQEIRSKKPQLQNLKSRLQHWECQFTANTSFSGRSYLYNGGLGCLTHGLVKVSGCLPESKKRWQMR